MIDSETGSPRAACASSAPRSKELHDLATRYLPSGISRLMHDSRPHPLYATSGSGFVVTDADGQKRVDFANNATSLIHGHAHPDVTKAIIERVRRGTAFSLCSEEQIKLAKLISDRVPTVEQVRFTNSGSEAVLYAIKAMRALTGKHKIVKFEGCYHGNADWAEVSLTPEPVNWGDDPSSVPYAAGVPGSVLSDVVVLRYNDIEELESRLPQVSDQVAGVLFDVMPARLGLVSCDLAWLEALQAVTRDLGLLLVSDEVINFRLAHGGAQEHFRFDADLTTFGKVIGGGLPVGAIGGSEALMRIFRSDEGAPAVPHSGTFNANPVIMAAGYAALELLTRDEVNRINGLAARLRTRLTAIFERSDVPAHVTGDGSLFQIHLTAETFRDYRSMWHSVNANADVSRRHDELFSALLCRGILLGKHGVGAISTPMTEDEVDLFTSAVENALPDIDFT